MNNNLLKIKIYERLNKLGSFDYDNIEDWQIAEAYNKSQLEWVRKQVYGYNARKQGTEQSTGLIDDLRVLMSVDPLKPAQHDDYYDAPFPDDYLYYIRADVMAGSKCCGKRRMVVYEVEEANIALLLRSTDKGPSFEWAETISTLVGNTVRVYTAGLFEITDIVLTYYRKPREVQFTGSVDISTGIAYAADQETEFKDDIAELFVDGAAAILAGDIESMSQYQRGQATVAGTT